MLLTNEAIKEIEEKVGYVFRTKEYLVQAFVRKSYSDENVGFIPNNELLEFYGDSVLNYALLSIMAEFTPTIETKVGERYYTPEELTNYVSFWTDKTMLSRRIIELNISKYLIMSKGDQKQNVQNNLSAQEDLFEAIIGAVWFDCDKDMTTCIKVVINMLNYKMSLNSMEKSAFATMKEFMDKNNGYLVDLISTDDGYIFRLTNASLNLDVQFNIAQVEPKNYHIAQNDGAKLAIKYLKDNNLWSSKEKELDKDVNLDNVVNKLKELFDKKIIKKEVIYNSDFNYDTNLWTNTLTCGDGKTFSSSAKTKALAKKQVSLEAYMYIINNLENN